MSSWALSPRAQTIPVCSRHGDLSGHLPGSTKVVRVLTPPLAHPTLVLIQQTWGRMGPSSPTSVLAAASDSWLTAQLRSQRPGSRPLSSVTIFLPLPQRSTLMFTPGPSQTQGPM